MDILVICFRFCFFTPLYFLFHVEGFLNGGFVFMCN